ncbi:MAG: helix-hairpin-helix domain-containing protein [Burkholderiaceae bacterium]|jgi:competence protein ComEA|nr:helix-hairpin-helix domain-containing protein [Burkholderiaceae bacterium]
MKIQRWLAALAAALSTTLALAAVDINTATVAELDGIKGIGPATSRLIQEERKAAPFSDWNDLARRVKGIGTKRAGKLSKEGLVVNGKSFDASTATAGSATAKSGAQRDLGKVAKAGKADKPPVSAK